MEMTIHERIKIQTLSFKELWLDLWQQTTTNYNHEYVIALNAFNRLMNSKMCKKLLQTLADSVWTTPEWGFPKGKRNVSENPAQCAVREMREESGLVYNRGYKPVEHNSSIPIQTTEIFQSTDKRIYRHVYYIYMHHGTVDYVFNEKNRMQMREVSDISWFTYTECLAHIRCYNIAKRKMLVDLHPTVVQYCELQYHTQINTENYIHKEKEVCCKQTEHTSATKPTTTHDGKDAPCHKATDCQQPAPTDGKHCHSVHAIRTLQPVS
jgi:8-oxo-dGTP pyrophosphatase MutT (NUDIX family)